MVETVVVVVLIVVVGVSVLAYRNRSEKGIESGISSFRRELRALAPRSKGGPPQARPPVTPPRSSGVGVLPPERDVPSDARPDDEAGAGAETESPSDDGDAGGRTD